MGALQKSYREVKILAQCNFLATTIMKYNFHGTPQYRFQACSLTGSLISSFRNLLEESTLENSKHRNLSSSNSSEAVPYTNWFPLRPLVKMMPNILKLVFG